MAEARPLAIRGGLILTPEWAAERADLLVEAGVIRAVVPAGAELPTECALFDATDRAIMPGLVNGHVHGHGTLAKGLVQERWPLDLFLNALPGLGADRTAQDKHLNGLLGAVEMIRKGTTACFDMFFEFPAPSRDGILAIAQAYHDAGIRAVVAPMIADRTYYQAYPDLLDTMSTEERAEALSIRLADSAALITGVESAVQAWPFDRSRVRPGIAPTIPLHCSDELLTASRNLARAHDLPMQTHLAETKAQAIEGLRRYGVSITAHLERLGLLGPAFSAAHGIWLDGDDLGRLAGATLVHAPGSNLRFGSGLAPVRLAHERGVGVGLATDGANTGDHLNMFEAMRLAAGVSAIVSTDFRRWLDAGEILSMATTGSARALGMEGQIGRIAPGYQADLVFLDLGHINYVPLGNLARQVVFTENAAAVDSVMVGGRLLLDHGRLTVLDETRLRRDAQAAADRLAGASRAARARAGRLQRPVEQFCLAMGCQPHPLTRLACT